MFDLWDCSLPMPPPLGYKNRGATRANLATSIKVVAVSSPVLKLRITGAAGAYKVLAQLGPEVAEGDLGTLPDNFREQLDPLQKSILYPSGRSAPV
jgi:hypothetical protein